MKLIAHRGNINSVNPDRENTLEYLQEAIEAGYDIEVDLWFESGKWYTGHDGPENEIKLSDIIRYREKVWIHCKNFECCYQLSIISGVLDHFRTINYFWHQNDDRVLTSQKWWWVYPGKELDYISVAVKPEICEWDEEELLGCYAICSDNVEYYREWLTNIQQSRP